jgi:hypothetical protein
MKSFIKWDNTNGWTESEVTIKENEFIIGEVYFENSNYKLIAESKYRDQFYLVAEWKPFQS